jgi:hypothetical protein
LQTEAAGKKAKLSWFWISRNGVDLRLLLRSLLPSLLMGMFFGFMTACRLLESGAMAFVGSGIEENEYYFFEGCSLLLEK